MIINPLKVWVQNILPVVYDDSLSYLEIVAKINAKTNEIITQTNENTHAIETLAETIAELGDITELRELLNEIRTIIDDLYTTDEPQMDGTASAGSADHAARSDHVHPSDTTRAPVNHASSENTYGVGTDSNYGHLKVTDVVNDNNDGTAIKPVAVKRTNENIAYVIHGDRSDVGIEAGKYVVLCNSTISTIGDGLYFTKDSIAINETITSAKLGNRITGGGLNDVEVISVTLNTDKFKQHTWGFANCIRIGHMCIFSFSGLYAKSDVETEAIAYTIDITPKSSAMLTCTFGGVTGTCSYYIVENSNTIKINSLLADPNESQGSHNYYISGQFVFMV